MQPKYSRMHTNSVNCVQVQMNEFRYKQVLHFTPLIDYRTLKHSNFFSIFIFIWIAKSVSYQLIRILSKGYIFSAWKQPWTLTLDLLSSFE